MERTGFPRSISGFAQSLWLLLALNLFSPVIHAAGFNYQQLGIAVTPRGYPNQTPEDIDNAFTLAKKLGQSAVFIYQWGKLDLNSARFVHEKTAKLGMHSIIGLSPTTLDQGRKELDIPEELRIRANGWISFANPLIRSEYKKTVIALAKLKPEYLCLATEINFLALQRPDEYRYFASLYKEAYDAVKRISPQTRVFVSFQYEWIRILDAKEPLKLEEHSRLIDIFRPKLDVIGLTTYPAEFHDSPLQLPPDYYSWIYKHIPRSNRILFMETGWPTQGAGSELEQVQFIVRLPALLKSVDVEGLDWALLHDVSLGEFNANFNTVGLITRDGQFKPGIKAFDDLTRSP